MEAVGRLPVPGARCRCGDRRAPGDEARSRILVVDEHELSAVGLRLALESMGWAVESSRGPTARDVVDHARRIEPWCVLLGVDIGDDLGGRTALVASLVATGAEVVVLTTERRRAVLAAYVEAGAAGGVPRSVPLDELHARLLRLRDGGSVICRTDRAELLDLLRRERCRIEQTRAVFDQLTDRESHVLAALADGHSAEQIAQEHFVAVTTIRSQIRSILLKLDVRSQLAAASLGGAYRQLLPDGAEVRDRRRVPGT